MSNLSKHVKLSVLKAPVGAANNTAAFGTGVDMQGFEGVMFVVPVTDSVATGIATLAAYDNSTNSSGSASAISGASATKTSAADDDINDKALIVDVYKPINRYVFPKITSQTANIAFGNIIALQYEAGFKPTTQDATVLAASLALGA